MAATLAHSVFRSSDIYQDGHETMETTFYNEKDISSTVTEVLDQNDLRCARTTGQSSPVPRLSSEAWHLVDSRSQGVLNEHGRYWWQLSGCALATLLENARYSHAGQTRNLEFFADSIASRLGVAKRPGVSQWKSFMTDNHVPIELSWDWHTGLKRPTIRFSVEPVSEQAGTAEDPWNMLIAEDFTNTIVSGRPGTDTQWFNHFQSFFRLGMTQHSPLGHQSNIFWAFDLSEEDVTSKAYFFPEYRAQVLNQTNLQVIAEAIAAAPCCASDDLGAFNLFQDFVREQETIPEMDMLAIDLVEPQQSRFKIYFRVRETSFRAVRNAMTLGGRIGGEEMSTGLVNLRNLWDRLFDQKGVSDAECLPASTHRTAGLLFNVEFRLSSKKPKVKIYIPVRHYAQNDWQIMNAVSGYMTWAKTNESQVDQTVEKTFFVKTEESRPTSAAR